VAKNLGIELSQTAIDYINSLLADGEMSPSDFFPGCIEGVNRLNVEEKFANDDEGFAPWVVCIDPDDGLLTLTLIGDSRIIFKWSGIRFSDHSDDYDY
jgi:hypothetical protein